MYILGGVIMKVDKREGCPFGGVCNNCELLKGQPYQYCTDDVEFAVCDCCKELITNGYEKYIEYKNRKGEVKDFCCEDCFEQYVLEEASEFAEDVETDFEHSEEWYREAYEADKGDRWYEAWKVGDL